MAQAQKIVSKPPGPRSKRRPVRIVGDVVRRPLADVKPNDWNPNHMSPSMRSSLRHGLIHDGWISSQALLVWGKDERGKPKNIIIDGEHRWEVATELGFDEAPMVFLDGLTREQASKLTVKFILKHGEPDLNELSNLVKTFEIEDILESSIDLGFDADALTRSLASTGTDFLNGVGGGAANGDGDSGNVTPEGYTLVFAFAKAEDKNRILSVLDNMKKDTRSAALLELADRVGNKL